MLFAGTGKRLKRDAMLEAIKLEWSSKPEGVLCELGKACSAYAPAEKKMALAHGYSWRTPSAQCKLAILDSPDGAVDRGVLKVQVRPLGPPAVTCERS